MVWRKKERRKFGFIGVSPIGISPVYISGSQCLRFRYITRAEYRFVSECQSNTPFVVSLKRVTVIGRVDHKRHCNDWRSSNRSSGDPRLLVELHRFEHHLENGSNDADIVDTLCNLHHDEIHWDKFIGRNRITAWIWENCCPSPKGFVQLSCPYSKNRQVGTEKGQFMDSAGFWVL